MGVVQRTGPKYTIFQWCTTDWTSYDKHPTMVRGGPIAILPEKCGPFSLHPQNCLLWHGATGLYKAYAASKYGLQGFFKSLHQEFPSPRLQSPSCTIMPLPHVFTDMAVEYWKPCSSFMVSLHLHAVLLHRLAHALCSYASALCPDLRIDMS